MSLTFDIYLFLPSKIFAYAKQKAKIFLLLWRETTRIFVQVMYRPMIYSECYYIVFDVVFVRYEN